MTLPPDSAPTPAQALGAALAQAWTSGTCLDPADWSLPDEAAAYQAQAELASGLQWLSPGRPQFWKCGGASRDAALGQSPLAPSGVREVRGLRNGGDFGDLRLFGAEAEIALRLGQDVTPEMAAELRPGQAEHLIDAMCVSIEWLSSRWQPGTQPDALLRLADAQTHGALALGPWQAWTPGRDWSTQACELQAGEAAVLGGVGGHGLNDPAWVMAGWLQFATRRGQTVPAGSVVTTGAWRVAKDLAPGTTVTVRFAGLGELSARN
ncbi:fumarylacetoacetate hydrolase family protein [Roseateles amylovorans]|uniref:Fumarylacetoacetate hydrolase family protein n=1 Tax=Roseateles amylovorans TaxID=2978473 RepID=A0ABY6B6G8_9BURK|nr:fumarylacetoacetate hydrolase family protein [Roseateles amylovorans]UXH78800.1 fumarylacetoacetate hydrolase family protein [Roseateles amylovorans]